MIMRFGEGLFALLNEATDAFNPGKCIIEQLNDPKWTKETKTDVSKEKDYVTNVEAA